MSQPQWARTDEDLLAAVQEALSAPPAPEYLVTAAKASFGWQSLDQELELMLLVNDSDANAPVGVRGVDGGLRLLDFQSGSLGVEVEVSSGFLMGQLIPMQPGRLSLQTPGGTFAETAADETGSFRLPRPAAGPVRLLCRTGSADLATEWTRL